MGVDGSRYRCRLAGNGYLLNHDIMWHGMAWNGVDYKPQQQFCSIPAADEARIEAFTTTMNIAR